MNRQDVGAWIGGPVVDSGPERNSRLGLPDSGPGSLAGTGRRVVALFIDWFAATIVARVIGGPVDSGLDSWLTLAVFFVEVTLLTWLSGASFGQRLVGLRVVGITRPLSLTGAALRTLLICLVIPPLVWDADGRGLHDKAVGTAVVRA